MFIRRTQTRSTASGETYFTHRLVRSERVGDKVRQRTLLNLGRHFDAAQSDWPALCRRIEEVLAGQLQLAPDCPPALESHAQHIAAQLLTRHGDLSSAATPPQGHDVQQVDVDSLELIRPRSVGVEHVGLWAMDQLGLRSCLEELGIGASLRAAAIGSIIARMARPGSERAARRWLGERSALDELLGVDFQTLDPMQLYRASDALMAHREAIEHHLFDRAMDLFDLHPTVTLYDLTNTYFEGEARGQPKARRGHSKEKRTDCPLLTLGLVLDASGFVRRSQVFAGNVREHHTLAEMLDALNAPRGALVVMDRGIATEDRVQWLREHRYRYLVVSRERTATSTPRRRCASRPHRVTACICTRCCATTLRRCACTASPRNAPPGARHRRALRQTLRGRAHQALRRAIETSYPETTRQGLAAHWSAQSSKPRRRPALRRRTRHRQHRTTRHRRALHSPPARRFDDDPSRRVLPAQQSNRLGRSHPVAHLLHPHRPRGGVPLTEIRTRSTPDLSPQADSRRRASVHHRHRLPTRAGAPAPPAPERRDCELDHAAGSWKASNA